MTKQRTEIGFGTSFEEIDPTEWKREPKPVDEKPKPPREEIRKVAQKSGFNSREAAPAPKPVETVTVAPQPVREGRIYRTGRSEQLNLKVRGEDKTGFYAICDHNHWVQGYTFQRAIEALRRELESSGTSPQPLSKSA
ncbi:MAG: hypothetical protein JSS38_11175 [Nitrospira sp.]|nr:hypothetical protein [Nitrospira sp.]